MALAHQHPADQLQTNCSLPDLSLLAFLGFALNDISVEVGHNGLLYLCEVNDFSCDTQQSYSCSYGSEPLVLCLALEV